MASSLPDAVARSNQYRESNHIDLTLDDDDDDETGTSNQYHAGRCAKRARTDMQEEHRLPPALQAPPPFPSYVTNSEMSPFASSSGHPGAFSSMPTSTPSPFSQFSSFVPQPSTTSYRPLFAGPSSSALPRPTDNHNPPPNRNMSQPPPAQPHAPRPLPAAFAQGLRPNDKQVIDLTDSPSPPPSSASCPSSQTPLPDELAPKTPVCIGQLTVTALIIYPVGYISPQPGTDEWASVKLQYDTTPNKLTGKETIHIRTPNTRSASGENTPGDVFGVVEQKVADFLGPMLGKGLIRLDAKIRKASGNLPILPLQLVVYTPKGNINVVGGYLRSHNLILGTPADIHRLTNYHYFNPHHDLLNSQHHAILASNSLSLPRDHSRWSTPQSATRNVEVQRSQVEELFKTMKDGDELPETEASCEVATKLYPHQKKALTFLFERERETQSPDGTASSLWQRRVNPITQEVTWYHVITQTEVPHPPNESKGAILADDMGLGKTITCVSLIAGTLRSSLAFGNSPLDPVQPLPPPLDAPDASHFNGSVWGMPDQSHQAPTSAKAKAKAERAREKLEAEYARACRIKAKSRATLIICPLSTVSNWEDQFREHWKGEVFVVGGGGGCSASAAPTPSSSQASSSSQGAMSVDEDTKDAGKTARVRQGRSLRVYIYHGNARRPDPSFLADFDAVITTYATLASEFSKQNRSLANAEEEEEENASDQGGMEYDERGNPVIRLPKPKKTGVKRKKTALTLANNPAEIPSALQSIHWFRVVLDEAHSIKETSTVASRACCDLVADRRLCLTGTPVQNKLDDVFALIKFLRLDPIDDKAVWTEYIGSPVKFGQEIGVARLQRIMKCITLRRTKESKAPDGKKILSLPPRRDELRILKFDEQEQEIYNRFFTESKAEFNDLTEKNEVMKNYVGILQKILRLRQICDHFELVEGKGLGPDSTGPVCYDDIVTAICKEGLNASRASAIFAILRDSGTTQCVECGGELCVATEASPEDADGPPTKTPRGRRGKGPASRGPTRANSPTSPRPVLTRCQHLFCIECYRNCICPGWPNVAPDCQRSCSACQTGLCPADACEVNPDASLEASQKKKPARREKRQKGLSLANFNPSTKIKALMSDLVEFSRMNRFSSNYDAEIQMFDADGSDSDVVKTVVFSQWTTMLDKIEDALEAAGIRYDRLDGTMKRDDRTRAMDALKHDPGCEVLLVSLKAGGVGLNLTAAQRVYLMDPYWNPAVENQAVDRIHRLGQTRPVTTIKLVIENSIEARLLEVQKKKTELANMTLGQNFTKAELMQRRLEDLQQLFSAS